MRRLEYLGVIVQGNLGEQQARVKWDGMGKNTLQSKDVFKISSSRSKSTLSFQV